ncbi:MAG: SMC-Scp complex subunit ScpB [Verrucomicrobiaceae bacterium]
MDLSSILESLLIASEAPLSSAELARLVRARAAELSDDSITEDTGVPSDDKNPESDLDIPLLAKTTEDDVVKSIAELNRNYEITGRSFNISDRAKGWKIQTISDYGGFVSQLFPGRKPERLSAPAMETLAVIAYRQPVTKAAIEAVRGVSCDGMLQKLLDRELVKIEGRADLPGRPLLYATTDLFLEHFGITGINDLPNIGELRQIQLPQGEPEETPQTDPETQLALSAVEKSSEDNQADAPAEEDFASPAPSEKE